MLISIGHPTSLAANVCNSQTVIVQARLNLYNLADVTAPACDTEPVQSFREYDTDSCAAFATLCVGTFALWEGIVLCISKYLCIQWYDETLCGFLWEGIVVLMSKYWAYICMMEI